MFWSCPEESAISTNRFCSVFAQVLYEVGKEQSFQQNFWFDTDFVDAECFPGSRKWLYKVMKKKPTTVVKIMTPYRSQPVPMSKVFRSWELIPSEYVFLSNSQMSDKGPVSSMVWFGRSFWQTLHLEKNLY